MAIRIRRGLVRLIGVVICLAVGGIASLYMVAQWFGPLLMYILK